MSREAEHLLLGRHGRSEANELKRFLTDDMIGHVPPDMLAREAEKHPLIEAGVDQATWLGEWVSRQLIAAEGLVPDNYFVSPLVRTEQTAGYAGLVIEREHPELGPIEWIRDQNLREVQRGDLEQLEKLPHHVPEPYESVLPTSPMYRRLDGGESLYEGIERWKTFRRDQRALLVGKTTLLVVHGYFMGAVEIDIEGAGMSDDQKWDLFHERSPGNCNVVHYTNVEPETGEISDRMQWVRAVMPYETEHGFQFEWREIGAPATASSAELVRVNAERYPRLLPRYEDVA